LTFYQVNLVTQEKIETITDMRNSSSYKTLADVKPRDLKPSDDDPIRALVLTGEDLESMAPEDWNIMVRCYTEIVFARTTPEQKLTIVEQLKARGDNTVAVTGDGVNDAPALKASDVGVAMGSGSDVAKEAGESVSMSTVNLLFTCWLLAAVILLNNDLSVSHGAISNRRN
jgi:sodium/potassium-transporting ATPase subunit alpha